ncbi:MAG: hypothetical protein L3J01_03580 [Thiomicrorhabdus sp.]|nr:hypothetical protein [Thiomicrorhabdus sp.]
MENKRRRVRLSDPVFGALQAAAKNAGSMDNYLRTHFKLKDDNPTRAIEKPYKSISARLSKSEYSAFLKLRKKLHIHSDYAFLRFLIRENITSDRQFSELEIEKLSSLIYQVSAIGRNLNQVVKHINQKGISSDSAQNKILIIFENIEVLFLKIFDLTVAKLLKQRMRVVK